MRGYPKHINTKKDFENVMESYPKDMWLPELKELLDDEFAWFTTGTLADGDEGKTDATHRVASYEDPASGKTTRTQEEWRVNPLCRMYQMGFTHTQVARLVVENS